MSIFSSKIPEDDIKAWLFDYVYRIDAALFEIESDYKKKKRLKELIFDRAFNYHNGKLHACAMLLNDFKIRFSFSPRVHARVKNLIFSNQKSVWPK